MRKIITAGIVCMIMGYGMAFHEAAAQTYTIGPGDVIEISVWKDDTLSRQVTVPPDGKIAFPLIDSVQVAGQTATQVKKVISKKLSEYIPDVTVTVMVVEINSLKAFVIGKVNAPGEYPIGLETNVMQILAKAEGLTPFASKSKILILRHEDTQVVKIEFDYGDVEKGDNLRQNIILQPGDVVVVP